MISRMGVDRGGQRERMGENWRQRGQNGRERRFVAGGDAHRRGGVSPEARVGSDALIVLPGGSHHNALTIKLRNTCVSVFLQPDNFPPQSRM